jgi:hypothetical protein
MLTQATVALHAWLTPHVRISTHPQKTMTLLCVSVCGCVCVRCRGDIQVCNSYEAKRAGCGWAAMYGREVYLLLGVHGSWAYKSATAVKHSLVCVRERGEGTGIQVCDSADEAYGRTCGGQQIVAGGIELKGEILNACVCACVCMCVRVCRCAGVQGLHSISASVM